MRQQRIFKYFKDTNNTNECYKFVTYMNESFAAIKKGRSTRGADRGHVVSEILTHCCWCRILPSNSDVQNKTSVLSTLRCELQLPHILSNKLLECTQSYHRLTMTKKVGMSLKLLASRSEVKTYLSGCWLGSKQVKSCHAGAAVWYINRSTSCTGAWENTAFSVFNSCISALCVLSSIKQSGLCVWH